MDFRTARWPPGWRAGFADRQTCDVRAIGAGEAIRTPDPNLGKVMLYP